MSFQTQVYINPAQAVAGDFASSNPMVFKLSSLGRIVAAATGVTVGKFAALNGDGTVSSTLASAPDASRIGFVHREFNAQINTFLAESGMTIAAGEPVALFGSGDFYATADVINGTPVRGAPVYWDVLTGNISVGTISSPPATTVLTKFILLSESATAGAQIIISSTGA